MSPYPFVLVMNKLTRYSQDDVLWCMLFADDTFSVHETKRVIKEEKLMLH